MSWFKQYFCKHKIELIRKKVSGVNTDFISTFSHGKTELTYKCFKCGYFHLEEFIGEIK